MHGLAADAVIRADRIRTFDEEHGDVRALAVRDGRILATASGADDLEGLIGPRTRVINAAGRTVIPSFYDTHSHLLLTAVDTFCVVQLGTCRSIAEIVDRVAEQARSIPPGVWIVSSRDWQDSRLAEKRLPTAEELDRATADHPVCLRRDGHVMVVNTFALRLAGLDEVTTDPEGGTFGWTAAGRPNGQLFEYAAYGPVADLVPEPSVEEKVDALGQMCRRVNSRGMTAVRDPGLQLRGELEVYERLRVRGELTVRTRALMWIRINRHPTVAEAIADMDAISVRSDFGDDLLRFDGIKTSLDGGVEGAALTTPYVGRPDFFGHLLVTADDLEEFVGAAADRGFRVAAHAVGDRAVLTAVEAYERVLATRPDLPPGWLSIEHAFFADADTRRRVIEANIGVTLQFPIVATFGERMGELWGTEKLEGAIATREWLEEGAIVSGGTDSNVASWDPLVAIWQTITRQDVAGREIGAGHAVDRRSAFELYTTAGPRAFGEADRRGTLVPGHLADFVAFDTDPLECDLDQIPHLDPAFTMLGGQAVYDRIGVGGVDSDES